MQYKDLNIRFDIPSVWRKPTSYKLDLLPGMTYRQVLDDIASFDKLKEDVKKEVSITLDKNMEMSNTKSELSQRLNGLFEHFAKAILVTDDYDEKFLLNKTNKNTLNKKLQPWCRNLVTNIPRIIESPPLMNLGDKFKGIPAFVVLAGPSLKNNIKQLRNVGDKGLVIATDTAFRPCLEAGVKVHLVMAHDANPQGMRFFLPHDHPFQNRDINFNDMSFEMLMRNVMPQLKKSTHRLKNDTIGVFVNYVHPLTVESFNGADLCFYQVMDPSLPVYDMMGGCSNWKKDGDKYVPERKGHIVGGSSVGHTATYLAVSLGCNPITIIGCDLSYPNGITYIPGASNQKDATKQRLIQVRDLSGKLVGTNISMFSYRVVFQRVLPQIIQQTGRTFYNATEHSDGSPAGILEVGAEPRRLSKIIGEYCKEDCEIVQNILKTLRGVKI